MHFIKELGECDPPRAGPDPRWVALRSTHPTTHLPGLAPYNPARREPRTPGIAGRKLDWLNRSAVVGRQHAALPCHERVEIYGDFQANRPRVIDGIDFALRRTG